MKSDHTISKMLSIAALIIIFATCFSGPVGVILVKTIAPQPTWIDADLFARNFHPIQSVPYYFGIILLIGFLLFFSSLPIAKTEMDKVIVTLTYFFTGMYAILIFINYFIQIAVIPNFLHIDAVITAFAADNGKSLFWYLEMTGYGFLGLATWTSSVLFRGSGKLSLIRFLLIVNGIISLFGAILNFLLPGWVFTIPGLTSYVIWNLLIVIIMSLIILEYRFGK